MPLKVTTFKLTTNDKERLRRLSNKLRLTRSDIVRLSLVELEQNIQEVGPEGRETLMDRAIQLRPSRNGS